MNTSLADTLLATGGKNMPLPSEQQGFDLDAGYAVAHSMNRKQQAAGKRLAGRKIGVSNRAAWDKLGLSDVVWGYMYEDTVHRTETSEATLSLAGLSAPRLEPEIVMGLKSPLPTGTRDPSELLKAVAWLALGFEVVQNPYPDWTFKPADLVATFGFHGALVIGPQIALKGQSLSRLAASLATTAATLYRGDTVLHEGSGTNVVDSPAAALGHLADLVAADGDAEPLSPGEVITTGTLTAAPDIAPGESYTAEVTGLNLPKLTLHLTK